MCMHKDASNPAAFLCGDKRFFEFLNQDIACMKGIGNVLSARLKKLGIQTPFHLLTHHPSRVQTFYHLTSIDPMTYPSHVLLRVQCRHATAVFPWQKKHYPQNVTVQIFENHQNISVVFFHRPPPYMIQALSRQTVLWLYGQLNVRNGMVQLIQPQLLKFDDGHYVPYVRHVIYPQSASLPSTRLRRLILNVLHEIPHQYDWMSEDMRNQYQWPTWKQAIWRFHHPESEEDLSPRMPWNQRLAFDEIIMHQHGLRQLLKCHNDQSAYCIGKPRALCAQIMQKFTLTHDQQNVWRDIQNDIDQTVPMMRMIHGEVGSGKTLLAFLTLACAADHQLQSALLAPTEMLAQQHGQTLRHLLPEYAERIVIITGAVARKKEIFELMRRGSASIIIGTHAMLYDRAQFLNLSVIVIDEQQRFGVAQRFSLINKGKQNPHVLFLSATPIPRTLARLRLGHMRISKLHTRPFGKQNVTTCMMNIGRLSELIERLKMRVHAGDKIFWICPRIQEDEEKVQNETSTAYANVHKRYADLSTIFPGQVGFLYGPLPCAQKNETIQQFIQNDVQILVATTVIDVGIDVPDATIMVIENANLFGLAQLHQLRGRIGRRGQACFCFLLYPDKVSRIAYERLKCLRQHDDGWVIAEHDLKLRGAGQILGYAQSGHSPFFFVDLHEHAQMLHEEHNLPSDVTCQSLFQHFYALYHQNQMQVSLQSG